MKVNPYESCPVYISEHFLLRRVERADADALLPCYSDPDAVANMNADNCTGDFYMTTLAQMRSCIDRWLEEYAQGRYVRFAVVDRAGGGVVGTVEIFGGERGILRVDLPRAYENVAALGELLALAAKQMICDFPAGRLYFKAGTSTVRREAALAQGFRPSESFRPGMGYFESCTGGKAR